jgi:hypothetical protein
MQLGPGAAQVNEGGRQMTVRGARDVLGAASVGADREVSAYQCTRLLVSK